VPPQQRRTTSDGPSVGELMRRIEDIVGRLDEMQRSTAEREARFEKTYVRSDVFQAVQTTDAVQVRGLEHEIHSLGKRFDATDARINTIEERRRQDRALVLSSLAFPLIIAVVTAVFLTVRL
jgi:phenylacetate-coenzyme A ligase PaaK-like adenylate-forming protein